VPLCMYDRSHVRFEATTNVDMRPENVMNQHVAIVQAWVRGLCSCPFRVLRFPLTSSATGAHGTRHISMMHSGSTSTCSTTTTANEQLPWFRGLLIQGP
jgi:hypothetical protein